MISIDSGYGITAVGEILTYLDAKAAESEAKGRLPCRVPPKHDLGDRARWPNGDRIRLLRQRRGKLRALRRHSLTNSRLIVGARRLSLAVMVRQSDTC